MINNILRGAVVVMAMASGAAMAEGRVSAADPQSVSDFFVEKGIEATLTADQLGDPLIQLQTDDGVGFLIWFYGCSDNADCSHLQFYRSYGTGGEVPLETLNTLNMELHFVKFVLDKDEDVAVLMEVFTGAQGMTPADFDVFYGQLTDVIGIFEEHVGWVPG
ncbi:YbjN domain-containing protein [Sinisalibacter lacisalsi]|nr:YbjN domain-containing protein [Sinisalibacter lacisalsi]